MTLVRFKKEKEKVPLINCIRMSPLSWGIYVYIYLCMCVLVSMCGALPVGMKGVQHLSSLNHKLKERRQAGVGRETSPLVLHLRHRKTRIRDAGAGGVWGGRCIKTKKKSHKAHTRPLPPLFPIHLHQRQAPDSDQFLQDRMSLARYRKRNTKRPITSTTST